MATTQKNSAADAERGNQFFQTSCALCHSDNLGPGNTVVIKQGPTLVGVMERKAGTSPQYGFSQALKDSGSTWNAEALGLYLTDPVRFGRIIIERWGTDWAKNACRSCGMGSGARPGSSVG